MNNIPVRIAWDAVPGADRYAVYVHPDGHVGNDFETVSPSTVVQVPENTMTLIYVTSRQGLLESISSEEMHVYASRW